MMRHVILGNLNEQSFSEILESESRQKWIKFFIDMKKTHSCNQCSERKWCTFCPGLFYEENGKYEIPSSYTCMITKIKKDLMMNG